jgi:hypothetical protein
LVGLQKIGNIIDRRYTTNFEGFYLHSFGSTHRSLQSGWRNRARRRSNLLALCPSHERGKVERRTHGAVEFLVFFCGRSEDGATFFVQNGLVSIFSFLFQPFGQQRRGTYMSTDPEPRWLWADDVGGWKAYTKDDSDLLEAIFVCVFFGSLVCAPPYSADRYCRLADLKSQFCYFVLSFFLVRTLAIYFAWVVLAPTKTRKESLEVSS